MSNDIEAAREWCRMVDCTREPLPTLLRALDALERETDEYGEHGTHEDYMASKLAQVEAVLASCQRARLAAEEEVARLRGCSDEEAHVLRAECGNLRAERDALRARLDVTPAGYRAGMEMDVLRAERDRLAGQVARVREAFRLWENHTITCQRCIDVLRALADRTLTVAQVEAAFDGKEMP